MKKRFIMNKYQFVHSAILILSLPILLHVYNPHMELGGIGIAIGFVGYVLSPILIFGFIIYHTYKAFRR